MNAIQTVWQIDQDPGKRLALLTTEGRRSVVRMNRELVQAYQKLKCGLWPFCVAHALVLTTQARASAGWYQAAAAYVHSGDRSDLTPARGYSASFGPDALQHALMSFRTLGEFTGISRLRSYDARHLAAAQQTAVQYTMRQSVTGLGAWLFAAPFELMAILRPSTWEDPLLDELLLPLGSPLARGFGMLRSAGMVDVDEQLLRDTEPGLRNGITLLYIARGTEEKLARQAKSRCLFIHHGIQDLGLVR